MIQEFINIYLKNKDSLKEKIGQSYPGCYQDLVRMVIETLNPDGEFDLPDSARIHQIDDGDYQGTLLFVIAATGYQPLDYWYVKVSYGSCSACDTLEGIRNYENEKPTEQQVNDYMSLCLHIVEGLKPMQEAF